MLIIVNEWLTHGMLLTFHGFHNTNHVFFVYKKHAKVQLFSRITKILKIQL
jgi:hypothetical protein